MQKYEKINSALRKNKNNIDINELAKLCSKGEFKTRQDLLNYLFEEVEKLDINANPKKCKYIYKGFKCLDNIHSDRDKAQVLKGIVKIQKLCISKVKNNNSMNLTVFDKILDIIKISLLNMMVDKDCDIKRANLINYVVYDLKNINYVYELLKTYPNYVFVKEEGNYVLENIVDKYLSIVLNGEYSYDLIYFEKIIKIFINHNKFKEHNELKAIILNKFKYALNTKKSGLVFIEDIVSTITNSNIITKTMDDIAKKYKVETTAYDENNIADCVNNDFEDLIDLRNLYTITIDGKNTVVYDDAVTYVKCNDGKLVLIVLVADVASYVPKGSLVDNVACKKCETVYLPQQTIKMLPNSLTNNFTLKEKCDRAAIGHFFVIENNEVINFKVKRCVINVNKNYSYEDVMDGLKNINNIEEFKFLTDLANLGMSLHEKSGNRLEYRAMKNSRKDARGIETYNTSISTLMIMEFMTLTNNYIAKYFASHPEIPFIFRSNTICSDDVINKLNSLSDDDLDILNRFLSSASFYTPSNLGHSGLSLDAYCHSTNPLRNYASLETQRIIIDSLINGIVPENYEERLEEINKLCTYMNERLESNKAFKEECKACNKKSNKSIKR